MTRTASGLTGSGSEWEEDGDPGAFSVGLVGFWVALGSDYRRDGLDRGWFYLGNRSWSPYGPNTLALMTPTGIISRRSTRNDNQIRRTTDVA
jgi:hypothetical protein